MPIHSELGISSITISSSTRRRLRRVTRPELKPRSPATSLLPSSRTLRVESSTQRLLKLSTQEDSSLPSHQDQGNLEELMVTSSKVLSSHSTKESSIEREERLVLSEHVSLLLVNNCVGSSIRRICTMLSVDS